MDVGESQSETLLEMSNLNENLGKLEIHQLSGVVWLLS